MKSHNNKVVDWCSEIILSIKEKIYDSIFYIPFMIESKHNRSIDCTSLVRVLRFGLRVLYNIPYVETVEIST